LQFEFLLNKDDLNYSEMSEYWQYFQDRCSTE